MGVSISEFAEKMQEKEVIQKAVFLIIAVLLINILIPFVTGSEKPMIVLSGSMVPFFLPGDIVIIKTVGLNELNLGDVLTFQAPTSKPGTFVTHRIISIEEGKKRLFQTKGDANDANDDFKVPESNVVGKLKFVIPFFGYLPDYLKHNINIVLLTIMLPASLLIIDEIKNLILYSNSTRVRKIERERKKAIRRTFYKLKGMRLAALILISGLVFAGIVNGPAILEREKQIDNSGFLPMVYVITPENSEQKLDIHSWYGVIYPANESQITVPKNTPVQISSAPYILPVFWIISLANINSYLPATTEVVIHTSFVTLLLFPIWYKKSIIGRHKKRISFKRRLAQWKRTFHLG